MRLLVDVLVQEWPLIEAKKRPGPQGSLVNICNLPSDIGTGSEKNDGWFYDSEKSECKAFQYSGAGGNANRYFLKKHDVYEKE